MTLENKTIKCFSCDQVFNFTTEEQELFLAKGHNNEPKRCPSCRQARKERQRSESGKGLFTANRTQPQLYSAVCTRCGKNTLVPFEPKADRPVYCRECYSTIKVSR